MNIDHSKPTKVWVWNDECVKVKYERYPVILTDTAICVDVPYEQLYLDGYAFHTVKWDHWGPIPEKKTRSMNKDELRKLAGKWVKHKDDQTIYFIDKLQTNNYSDCTIGISIHFINNNNLENYQWADTPEGPWHEFEVEEGK